MGTENSLQTMASSKKNKYHTNGRITKWSDKNVLDLLCVVKKRVYP